MKGEKKHKQMTKGENSEREKMIRLKVKKSENKWQKMRKKWEKNDKRCGKNNDKRWENSENLYTVVPLL